jgi:hypothetical protein
VIGGRECKQGEWWGCGSSLWLARRLGIGGDVLQQDVGEEQGLEKGQDGRV